MKYLIVLLAVFMSACTVTRANIENVTPNELVGAEFPLDASIQIYIPRNELNEKYMFIDGFGGRHIVETGQDLHAAANEISTKYFSESRELMLGSPTHYVLRLRGDTDINTFWGTYKVVLDVTLLDNGGRVVDERQVEGSATSGVLNDSNAYFNAYVKAAKDYFDTLFAEKGAEIIAFTEANNRKSFLPDDPASIEAIEPVASGTGFIINGSGQLVTNSHVISSCIAATVSKDGEETPADVVFNDEQSDIAVVATNLSVDEHALFSEQGSEPRLGEQIIAAGYPLPNVLSESISLTIGNVSSLAGFQNDQNTFQISAPIQGGSSGGPVLGADGLVYGVVQSKLNVLRLAEYTGEIAQNVNFAIKKDGVLELLDANEIEYSEADPVGTEKLDVPDIGERAAEYTLQVMCYG